MAEYGEAVMSVDELFKVVDSLSEPDLDNLVKRALFVRARRKTQVLSEAETGLLLAINQGIPATLHERYEQLLELRDDERLTAAESAELLAISGQIEGWGVRRIEALAQLATLRQVPLPELMSDLGIHSPGVR
jgi:hypothetical protein